MNDFMCWLNRITERIILHKLSTHEARVVTSIMVAALVVASGPVLHYRVPPIFKLFTSVSFPLCIFLSCLFFKRQGSLMLVPACVLLLLSLGGHQVIVYNHTIATGTGTAENYFESTLPLALVDIFLLLGTELFKWILIAFFTIVTTEIVLKHHENENRLERDVDMARTLQRALIPKNCAIGRVKVCGIMRQCHNVGGDFYYFRPFQEKFVVFCLGDVMGKGIPAAMIMSIVMGFFFEWGKKSSSPAEILQVLNKRLLDLWSNDDETMFSTLFYGVFNEETGLLTYASGGHDTALLLHADGHIDKLHADGLPIGAFRESTWEEIPKQLEGGDRVILFTDGLTEARKDERDFFGLERVIDFVQKHAELSSEELLQGLEGEAMHYTNGALSDDLAILIMEVIKDAVWTSPSKKTEQ